MITLTLCQDVAYTGLNCRINVHSTGCQTSPSMVQSKVTERWLLLYRLAEHTCWWSRLLCYEV